MHKLLAVFICAQFYSIWNGAEAKADRSSIASLSAIIVVQDSMISLTDPLMLQELSATYQVPVFMISSADYSHDLHQPVIAKLQRSQDIDNNVSHTNNINISMHALIK